MWGDVNISEVMIQSSMPELLHRVVINLRMSVWGFMGLGTGLGFREYDFRSVYGVGFPF